MYTKINFDVISLPLLLSIMYLDSHRSSIKCCTSSKTVGLVWAFGCRNFRNILWALDVNILNNLGLLNGLIMPLLDNQ